MIELASKRGAPLTRRRLTFSRRQRVYPTAVEIPDLMVALSDVFTSGVDCSVALRINVPPETWSVKVDPGERETAVVNLAIDARDAMPDGGVVSVMARNGRACARSVPA